MIKFKEKEYSIREGHYTGPKDEERVPSTLTLMAKGAGAGALAGTVIGAAIKEVDSHRERLDRYNVTPGDGLLSGAKYGALSGIALKVLLNYMHNPMKSVKYQDVDKNLRCEFGVYRLSGVTVGDSVSRRASIDEKFGFNDRRVTDYKLTFCISNNKITMYTFGLTEKELEKVDSVLDYYCKKYYGMEYSSTAICERNNSYAVYITFTNCQVVANFIMELSNALETRINLMDNNSLAKIRYEDASKEVNSNAEEDPRNFSVADINRFDAIEMLGKPGISLFINSVKGKMGLKAMISNAVIGVIMNAVQKTNNSKLAMSRVPVPRFMLDNKFLEGLLKKCGYVEGFHYTVKNKTAKTNISISKGLMIITTLKDSDDCKRIDEAFWKKTKGKVRRSEVNGKVIVYNYSIESKSEAETYIKMLMSTGIVFNIFE